MPDPYPTPAPWTQTISTWVTSHAYVVGNYVYNSLSNLYRCSSNHTSGASTEPGVGGSWATVWTLEGNGPMYLKFLELVPEYRSTIVKEFKDGGAAIGLPSTSPVLRYRFEYNGLTAAQASLLDDHYVAAQGQYLGFNFRHPRTGVLYTDVHYDESGMEPEHERVWVRERTVVLIKRPA